ncbi:MAG: hypothetical protein HRU28_07070 [Rhizobiales bacterium]|nr:hypothetical protein [Hyphomicrobiales bacterium]
MEVWEEDIYKKFERLDKLIGGLSEKSHFLFDTFKLYKKSRLEVDPWDIDLCLMKSLETDLTIYLDNTSDIEDHAEN